MEDTRTPDPVEIPDNEPSSVVFDGRLDRQPRETNRAYTAFKDWCRMGARRSNYRLVDYYAKRKNAPREPLDSPSGVEPPPTVRLKTLKQWSVRFEWMDRVRLFDAAVETMKAKAHSQAIRDMAVRHANIGLLLQQLAVDKLQAVTEPAKDLTVAQAERLTKLGIDVERLARGRATESQDVHVDGASSLQRPIIRIVLPSDSGSEDKKADEEDEAPPAAPDYMVKKPLGSG